MESGTSLFTKADLAEREKRRLALAKAEIETSLAEKELQDWYRNRSKSSDLPKTPQSIPGRVKDLPSPTFSSVSRPVPRSEVTSPGGDIPTKTRPPSYPRLEIKARTPGYHQTVLETDYKSFVSHHSEPQATPKARPDQIDAVAELQREMDKQRVQMLQDLDRRMKQYQVGKLPEPCLSERSPEREPREGKGNIVGMEETGRGYEGKITTLTEQLSQKEKEIERLQRLLSTREDTENTQTASLRLEIERLNSATHSQQVLIQQLQSLVESQNTELMSLKNKLEGKARLEADYTALAKELTEEKLRREGDLKLKVRQMEQEHEMLQRDYDTLATMHKRALKDLKRVQSEEGRNKTKPGEDVRKQYEGKMQALEEETMAWKDKTRRLVTRYFHALEKLQRDNKALRQDQMRLETETREQMAEVHKKLTELRRSRPQSRN